MKKTDFLKTQIKDNNYKGLSLDELNEKDKKSAYDILQKAYAEFSKKNIKELVTSTSFGEEFDANQEQKLFELKGDNVDNSKIYTFNLVGTILYQKHTLNINSRFGDYFLQYMIASSNGFLELENSGGFDDKEVSLAEWIFVYYFKIKLKDAFNLGMYKTYTKKSEDLLSIRGQIDINYYIKKEIFDGKTRCNYKDHSYENEINYVISLAINKVFKKYPSIVQDIHTIKNAFNEIEHKKQSIKFLKNKKVKNPFYNKYNEVFKLAFNIINDDFGATGQKDFSAFLFDISLLFEHHIRILLKQKFNLSIKNQKEFTIPNGINQNNIYPDIVIENEDGSISIYDVKYKHFRETGENNGVNREDRFQLVSYVAIYSQKYEIKECGFIYPSITNQKEKTQSLYVFDKEIPFKIKFYTIADTKEKKFKDFILNQKEEDEVFLESFYKKGN